MCRSEEIESLLLRVYLLTRRMLCVSSDPITTFTREPDFLNTMTIRLYLEVGDVPVGGCFWKAITWLLQPT